MTSTMRPRDIAYNVFCRYEKTGVVNGYPGLFALYGLAQLAGYTKEDFLIKKVRAMLTVYPDAVRHPHYNFESYRVGGNGRAYLVMSGMDDEGREVLDHYADLTMHAPVDHDGIQCMPGTENNEFPLVWIDVVAATTPFMTMAGVALGREDYIRYGAEQCFKMYDLFEDPDNHLLHQSRGFRDNRGSLSEDHWSRGNGWGIVGLADLVQYLPAGHKLREEAARRLRRHCEALRSYQTKRGLWRQSIACDLAWEESSGTGQIAYAIGIGLRCGVLDRETYWPVFEKAMNGIVQYCLNRDFSTERSCCGCLCPGEGEERGTIKAYLNDVRAWRDEPHSFGSLILALVEADKNGITEIGWNRRK